MTEQEKFRVDIQVVEESIWSSNEIEFDTKEEAETYAKDLRSRWMGMDKWRVVPSSTPRGEKINES